MIDSSTIVTDSDLTGNLDLSTGLSSSSITFLPRDDGMFDVDFHTSRMPWRLQFCENALIVNGVIYLEQGCRRVFTTDHMITVRYSPRWYRIPAPDVVISDFEREFGSGMDRWKAYTFHREDKL